MQAEAASSGSLAALRSRALNIGYAALTAAAGYFTLSGRSDQVGKEEVLSLESVDRWSTNTQAAGSLAAIICLFYLSQALIPPSAEPAEE